MRAKDRGLREIWSMHSKFWEQHLEEDKYYGCCYSVFFQMLQVRSRYSCDLPQMLMLLWAVHTAWCTQWILVVLFKLSCAAEVVKLFFQYSTGESVGWDVCFLVLRSVFKESLKYWNNTSTSIWETWNICEHSLVMMARSALNACFSKIFVACLLDICRFWGLIQLKSEYYSLSWKNLEASVLWW